MGTLLAKYSSNDLFAEPSEKSENQNIVIDVRTKVIVEDSKTSNNQNFGEFNIDRAELLPSTVNKLNIKESCIMTKSQNNKTINSLSKECLQPKVNDPIVNLEDIELKINSSKRINQLSTAHSVSKNEEKKIQDINALLKENVVFHEMNQGWIGFVTENPQTMFGFFVAFLIINITLVLICACGATDSTTMKDVCDLPVITAVSFLLFCIIKSFCQKENF